MRCLLDTHIWLWMLASPERITGAAGEIVADSRNDLMLSAVSSWEIAIKHAIGRLTLPEPPESFVPARMQSTGVVPLPISHFHALRVAALPVWHRDPFDRLLVAQAQVERLTLVTADPAFARYDVQLAAIEMT